jgi:hypothetical protein
LRPEVLFAEKAQAAQSTTRDERLSGIQLIENDVEHPGIESVCEYRWEKITGELSRVARHWRTMFVKPVFPLLRCRLPYLEVEPLRLCYDRFGYLPILKAMSHHGPSNGVNAWLVQRVLYVKRKAILRRGGWGYRTVYESTSDNPGLERHLRKQMVFAFYLNLVWTKVFRVFAVRVTSL